MYTNTFSSFFSKIEPKRLEQTGSDRCRTCQEITWQVEQKSRVSNTYGCHLAIFVWLQKGWTSCSGEGETEIKGETNQTLMILLLNKEFDELVNKHQLKRVFQGFPVAWSWSENRD